MIIAGAGGFAIEILEVIYKQGITDIAFYDDVNPVAPDFLFDQFPVLKNANAAAMHFAQIDKRFVIGTGSPGIRKHLADKLTQLGGTLTSVISSDARIGSFGNLVNEGVSIMQGAIITNNIKIGKGSLINLNTTIGHGSTIGDFCDLSPGVRISGNCRIGGFCTLGSNAVVLPNIKICDHVTIGASGVVNMNISEQGTYVGIPVKKIK
jgi:sugar O-acyltransferase (sialic acid O-acetyltransferase NeuD family)